jgi:hypothetical protein
MPELEQGIEHRLVFQRKHSDVRFTKLFGLCVFKMSFTSSLNFAGFVSMNRCIWSLTECSGNYHFTLVKQTHKLGRALVRQRAYDRLRAPND